MKENYEVLEMEVIAFDGDVFTIDAGVVESAVNPPEPSPNATGT